MSNRKSLWMRVRAISFTIVLGLVFSAFVFVATTRAQLAASAWPMFDHDLRHTGLSNVDTSGNNGTLKWSLFEAGSPVIGADGTLYSACSVVDSGVAYSLCALNPDGSQKWVFGPTEEVDINGTSPAIGADGTIYYGLTEPDEGDFSMFYAVNPDGSQKWAVPGAGGTAPAIGTDGTIYVHAGCALDAYNPGDGSLKWSVENCGSPSPAIGADGTIYVGGDNGVLYALNPVDGSNKWLFATEGNFIYSSPAIGTDGTIYIGDEEFDSTANFDFPSHFYAVNPDGSQKWVFAANGSFGDSTPAIGADGTIYIGDEEYDSDQNDSPSHLYALNPDGSQKWAFTAGGLLGSSPAIGADGTIYIADSELNPATEDPTSHLYAVNSDGTLKWSLTTAAGADFGASGSPVIGPDGTVYVGSGYIYAVGGPPTSISVPTSLAFGNSPVADAVTKNLTIRNIGKTTPLFIGSVTSSDTAEFAETGSTCPSGGLAHGLSCTIAIRFTPSTLGVHSATLTLTDNTATSPQHVTLTGTGTIDMAVTPASYGFGSVKDGSKATKAITVHNDQTNAVSLGEGFSGPNAGDFTVTGGTCTSTLAAKAACSLIVTFAPTAMGTESATMTVTDSPDTLGPYIVSFTALATVPEALSATKLAFGSVYQTASKTLYLTVSNKATSGPITLTGTTIGGANASDFAVTGGSCGSSLPASSSCTYAVTFTPSAEGAEDGTVSVGVAEDPNGGPTAVTLTGTGLAPLRVTPASSSFGTLVDGHTSTARTITVANLGGAAISLSESISGTNGGDLAVTGGTCGVSLAGGTSCTYQLKFTASIVGPESATLAVSGVGDAASPHNVSLSGTGS